MSVVQIELALAKNGALSLKCGNPSMWIHSSYDPVAEGIHWAEAIDCSPDDIVIVVGIGLGYHVKALADKIEGKIIALEPSQELQNYCKDKIVFEELIKDGKVILFDHAQPLTNFLTGLIDQFRLEKVKVVDYLPIQRCFPQEFLQTRRKINDALFNLLVSATTTLCFSRAWTENVFENLNKVCTAIPAHKFFNAFPNRPGIIVSAGPSLNKNIHLLKNIKGRAVILVVGTALKPVLYQGITPDIAVSMDGGEPNYRHFEGVDTSSFPLLFDAVIYPRILAEYKGPLIASIFLEEFNSWLTKLGLHFSEPVRTGPSVANMAFDFALKLGLNPIIFIGQDLAFTGGRSHARGTVYENREPTQQASRLLEIEGIDGGKVLTDRVLYGMLQYLETQIALTAGDRQIINATEGGAKIAGTQGMTLGEAADRYCQEDFNPEGKIKEICSSYKPPDKEERAAIAERIREEEKAMKKAVKVGRLGARLAQELENVFLSRAPDPHQINKLLKRLDRVDAELQAMRDELLPIALIFQPIWFQLNKGPFAQPADDWQKEGLRIARKSKFLYEGLGEGIEIVRRAMLKASDKLGGMRKEEKVC